MSSGSPPPPPPLSETPLPLSRQGSPGAVQLTRPPRRLLLAAESSTAIRDPPPRPWHPPYSHARGRLRGPVATLVHTDAGQPSGQGAPPRPGSPPGALAPGRARLPRPAALWGAHPAVRSALALPSPACDRDESRDPLGPRRHVHTTAGETSAAFPTRARPPRAVRRSRGVPAQGATGLAPPRYAKRNSPHTTREGTLNRLNWCELLPGTAYCFDRRGSPRTTSAAPPDVVLLRSRTRVACLHGTGSVSSAFSESAAAAWRNLDRAELFIGGLPDHIRVDVELQAPRDLQTAMHYARAYEPTRTFRRLTPAEQLERRRLGLCFNCDDPYTPGHVCPRLFYLETVDIEEGDPMAGPVAAASEMAGPADAAATAFVVSLHALAGIRHERTMLLPVTIQGEPLVALLDTGSTHNFLPAATMRRLALQPTSGDSLRVTVANGDRLHCHGVVQHVPLTIGDEHFVITCAGIDLGCFDFILGVDFLRTLGPILWDFDALTMTFWATPHPLGGPRGHIPCTAAPASLGGRRRRPPPPDAPPTAA
ncbi:hypothetical protein QYE76_040151 [Lolium multiflorum]|uniref:Uncharacterized protein n=1 Tax=Lolium multiflorum TaxID=4521 RepID=A0AAD8TC96_LOLMU|nr:hypothetical protein QYE76_040151 [Lolium multiflorum]